MFPLFFIFIYCFFVSLNILFLFFLHPFYLFMCFLFGYMFFYLFVICSFFFMFLLFFKLVFLIVFVSFVLFVPYFRGFCLRNFYFVYVKQQMKFNVFLKKPNGFCFFHDYFWGKNMNFNIFLR